MIKEEIKEVAKTGILPDGDHINTPTQMWLEDLSSRLAELTAQTIKTKIIQNDKPENLKK